jgi:hypothetical protein
MTKPLFITLSLVALGACSNHKPATDPATGVAAATPPASQADGATANNADPSPATKTWATERPPSDERTSNDQEPARKNASSVAPREPQAATPIPEQSPQPDNSAVNKRDRESAALTPIDQGGGAADIKITQRIRQAVMSDKTLSFTAKNVKIITVLGKVTLRGPVNSAQERDSIEIAARNVAGVTEVVNQLEVKP